MGNLRLIRYFMLFSVFVSHSLWGMSIPKNDDQIISKYLNVHKKFSSQNCRGGTEPKFWRILRKYFGDGYYVPLTHDDDLDREVITLNLPKIKGKIDWIERNIKYVKGLKNFGFILTEIRKLFDDLDYLIALKKEFYEEGDPGKKRAIRVKSREFYEKFQGKFLNFLDRVPFMVSYDYPVDHLKLRSEFDKFKFREDKIGVKKSNRVYFYRKIVEDGAQNPNHTKSDMFLRTTISTVALALKGKSDFVPETIRYDINSVLTIIKNHLSQGKTYKLKRLKEWKGRIQRKHDFYQSLLTDEIKSGEKTSTTKDYVKDKSRARFGLKQYVLDKQKDVYEFWTNENELNRALYVIETILFNEVGGLDGSDALERRDVTQVVINRKDISFYSTIPESDSLYSRLKELKLKKDLNDYKWLNTLFKEGEFSFTYYFISANVRVFCPDQTGLGKKLRKQNLKIALELLRKPNSKFEGVRYFSRASMIGRINMSSLWSEFIPIPERPGRPVSNSKDLMQLYERDSYKLLYHFDDGSGRSYKVLQIGKKKYVMEVGKGVLYKYRDPNHFQFFKMR